MFRICMTLTVAGALPVHCKDMSNKELRSFVKEVVVRYPNANPNTKCMPRLIFTVLSGGNFVLQIRDFSWKHISYLVWQKSET